MTDTVERHPSRGDLEKLLKAKQILHSESGAQRQRYGEALSKATKKGLDKAVFGWIERLWRMDPAKAAHKIRAFNLYVDLLGLAVQADLEDVIEEAEEEGEHGRANGKILTVEDRRS